MFLIIQNEFLLYVCMQPTGMQISSFSARVFLRVCIEARGIFLCDKIYYFFVDFLSF